MVSYVKEGERIAYLPIEGLMFCERETREKEETTRRVSEESRETWGLCCGELTRGAVADSFALY